MTCIFLISTKATIWPAKTKLSPTRNDWTKYSSISPKAGPRANLIFNVVVSTIVPIFMRHLVATLRLVSRYNPSIPLTMRRNFS